MLSDALLYKENSLIPFIYKITKLYIAFVNNQPKLKKGKGIGN